MFQAQNEGIVFTNQHVPRNTAERWNYKEQTRRSDSETEAPTEVHEAPGAEPSALVRQHSPEAPLGQAQPAGPGQRAARLESGLPSPRRAQRVLITQWIKIAQEQLGRLPGIKTKVITEQILGLREGLPGAKE